MLTFNKEAKKINALYRIVLHLYKNYCALKSALSLLFLLFISSAFGQVSLTDQINAKQKEVEQLKENEKQLKTELERLKLARIRLDLEKEVLPEILVGEEVIMHAAMALVYSEKDEQAKWVAHIITPDVSSGLIGRSNDFRPDSLIKTGSATEEDYFLKEKLPDGNFKYDGFGFDRGHLAPSADFRWSAKALSESFYYSNMSPQRPEFNRVSWAKLEDLFRSYVDKNKTDLYVVTGPVLREGLPKVERAKNKPTIPVYYYKVVVDKVNKRAISFLMPNKLCEGPTESYSVSIDSIESLTGINFFAALPDELEKELEQQKDVKPWMSPKEQNDIKPLDPTELPKKHFNTVQAKLYKGLNETITVCGTVVSTKLSSKGNIFLNLDKGFPNQIFTITIFKDKVINFSYLPNEELFGKTICIEGKVADFNGTPSMVVDNEHAIKFYENE